MDRSTTDVVIVGAGPNGLSLASLLSHRNVKRRIFGYPMQAWRDMPPGMSLKSFGFATNIPTDAPNSTLPEWCRERNLEDFEPIATSAFADYGDWIQQKFVPDVEKHFITGVKQSGDGFVVTVDTGEEITARRVIVASGLGYFKRIPSELQGLPEGTVTHGWDTAAYLKTGAYAGKDVTVIGAGQTALEAAALLHEGGATVRIVARRDVWWSSKMSRKRCLITRLREPNTMIGPGRLNWVIEHVRFLMYYAPTERRVRFTRKYLGPLGTWWLRDRVDGKIPVLPHTSIASATMKNDRIALRLRNASGQEQEFLTDHILSATGYEADVDRLPFLSRDIAGRVARVERAPKLSPNFESSVKGLYFVGPMASFSFGPLVRFVAGATYYAPKIANHVARSL